MPKPTVEDRARSAPAKCVISGSGDGPIINTGRQFQDGPPKGTIYVAPRSISRALDEIGWLAPKSADALKERVEAAEQELAEQTEELESLRPIAEALRGLEMFEREVEVKEVERVVVRDPEPDEIRAFVEENPDHPLVQHLAKPERGSLEEWQKLYGPKGPRSRAQQRADEAAEQRKATKAQSEVDRSTVNPNVEAKHDEESPDAPQRYVSLHGQKVDLDEVLEGTVKEVEAYAEGHPAEFRRALLARERHGKDRVTLTESLESGLDGADGEPDEDDEPEEQLSLDEEIADEVTDKPGEDETHTTTKETES